MSVRAKFVCESVTQYSNPGKSIKLRAVSDGSPENKAFFQSTPSAELTMAVVNPEAADQFVPGKSYYVDFTPADPAV